MPIRFVCEHCRQRLSVGTRKAGSRAKCPKCRQHVTVPASQEEADEAAGHVEASDESEELDPFSEFVVYDQNDEFVYEDETSPEPVVSESRPVDRNKVAVPRQVLYLQGALLGVVAILAFLFGIVVGGATASRQVVQAGPTPCVISGAVTFKDPSGAVLPDDGAVVVVLPENTRPDEKTPVDGLIPRLTAPDDGDPTIRSIRAIGGQYTRTDVNGQYQVRIEDTGKYFVLVLSRHATRPASQPIKPAELAQIGRFFQLAPEAPLGEAQFSWKAVTFRRNRRWDVKF